jgi:hypothetical protein
LGDIKKRWDVHTKKEILELMLRKNTIDKTLTLNFLEKSILTNFIIINGFGRELRIKLIFFYQNELLEIFGGYELDDNCFHWNFPYNVSSLVLVEILDRFKFENYLIEQ